MSDNSKKTKQVFENINKEFSRLEELGLMSKAKDVYASLKKSYKEFTDSDEWKILNRTARIKIIQLLQGDKKAAEKGAQIWRKELGEEGYSNLMNAVSSMPDKGSKAVSSDQKEEDPSASNKILAASNAR